MSVSQRGNQCTLRAAIEEANDTTGADAIRFDISGKTSVKTISPTSELPEVTDPVTINGYTRLGATTRFSRYSSMGLTRGRTRAGS